MPEPMDRLLRKHASREYLWFALILLAVLAGSITRQAEINDSHALPAHGVITPRDP
jgi:hypothetical protein